MAQEEPKLSEVEELIKGIYYAVPNDSQLEITHLNPNNSTPINLPIEYFSCCGPKLFEKYENKLFSNN